jgi:DNA mismatch endonuclease (patch repair protein)
MSSVKSKNTISEITLRKALWRQGLRFRVNYKELPGKPDIVFTRAKVAVFCDGDYWHGHNWALRGLKDLDEELT